jgi:hypothetical protein
LSEKYLGLPTAVGRSKEGVFKHLPERSWSKVHGWKGQGLSMEGKETFIKSVLQAVPAYPMGCFRLPNKTCTKVTSISSGFWWGSADGKRKVPWVSWEKMSAPKRRGGMGFRNFSAFNQALLAKQAWRILTNPTSLCSRVLAARYFKKKGILTAECPKSASFTFRSILHGRDLLKEGTIWRIGNGSKVKVWEDNWIPRSGLKRPLGHKPHTEVSLVEELLQPNGQGWNEAKLNDTFFQGDVDDIMSVPVGRAGTDDYIAWNYTKNGVFSVKSAYHLKMQMIHSQRGRATSSRTLDEHRGWLALWAADVPGKAKIHVWRLIKKGFLFSCPRFLSCAQFSPAP